MGGNRYEEEDWHGCYRVFLCSDQVLRFFVTASECRTRGDVTEVTRTLEVGSANRLTFPWRVRNRFVLPAVPKGCRRLAVPRTSTHWMGLNITTPL